MSTCVSDIYAHLHAHTRIQVHAHRGRDMAYADCFSKCNIIRTETERLNMYETAHKYNSAEQMKHLHILGNLILK